MIDSAKSYQSVMLSLEKAIPSKMACINSHGVGAPQQALLDYYTNLRLMPLETSPALSCDLLLVQNDKRRHIEVPGNDWSLIWEGKRPADRRESFSLYQKKD